MRKCLHIRFQFYCIQFAILPLILCPFHFSSKSSGIGSLASFQKLMNTLNTEHTLVSTQKNCHPSTTKKERNELKFIGIRTTNGAQSQRTYSHTKPFLIVCGRWLSCEFVHNTNGTELIQSSVYRLFLMLFTLHFVNNRI